MRTAPTKYLHKYWKKLIKMLSEIISDKCSTFSLFSVSSGNVETQLVHRFFSIAHILQTLTIWDNFCKSDIQRQKPADVKTEDKIRLRHKVWPVRPVQHVRSLNVYVRSVQHAPRICIDPDHNCQVSPGLTSYKLHNFRSRCFLADVFRKRQATWPTCQSSNCFD